MKLVYLNWRNYKAQQWCYHWSYLLQKFRPQWNFQTLTSAIPVHCSSIWAVGPTFSWSLCEFMMTCRGWISAIKVMYEMLLHLRIICSLEFLFSLVLCHSGCISTFITVYMEDGLRKGLYRGLSINYMRVVPQVAVMFSVYEITKQILNDNTANARSEWVLMQCSGIGIQKLHKAIIIINSSKKEKKLWAQEVIWVRQDVIKYNYWK